MSDVSMRPEVTDRWAWAEPTATTVLIVGFAPGSRAYCDTRRAAPPVLVTQAGPTEVQFALAAGPVTAEDLHIVDGLIAAWTEFSAALLRDLD